ncbi:MAG: peptidase domain protein [Bacteroidetes bacterium]|nr:peptidase domain protein [Bacteroidota bacterium]
MKYFRFLCCSVVLAMMATQAEAQAPADVYKVVKANNGQSYLPTQANTGGVLYTDVYFRISTVYELDSMSGISLMITRIIDERVKAALKGKSIAYHSSISPAQIGFHFESTAADIDNVLALVHDKVMMAKFDDESTEEAKAAMRADIDSIRHSEQGRTDMAIKMHLWGRDYKKLDVYGDQKTYAHIETRQFTYFHDKFFLPLNNAVMITGTFAEQETVTKMEKAFNDFRTREFNPELIRRVIEFKPVVNAVQLVSRSTEPARLTVSYQAPGARQDRSATYSAYMLTALINDANGRISKYMNDAGIRDLKAFYDCNNFQGTLTISAHVPSGRYNDAFSRIDSMIIAFCRPDYFTDEEFLAEGKSIGSEFEDLRRHTHIYMMEVARYRFSNDENYFPSLSDSIQSVTVPMMQRYVNDYFQGHAGIKCLYIDSNSLAVAPEDQHYYAIDESIKDLTFTYPNNVTDIDTISGREDLQRLIQWLRINPDMHVQINGFSDKGEYTKSYDTTVAKFLKNTPTFRKAMPDAIKVGYLRIEMMRAMRIAKALYEAGITDDRITGTSMTFSSDSDEAAALNRKCTVTLEKIQARVSLYEYHFGKKKEDEPAAPVGQ